MTGVRNRTTVLEGMRDRSISCLKAFGVLEMVTERGDFWSDIMNLALS
jgi:hypothetical protein